MACNCYFPGDCDGSCQHPEPPKCEACDGSGVEVFGITVYEPGCGFSHPSTDERPCRECDGSGYTEARREPDRPSWLGTRPIQPNTETQDGIDTDVPF